MQTSPRHREYWQKNLRISAILLAIWFVVTYVVGFYARDLYFTFFGWPFSVWRGGQGALIGESLAGLFVIETLLKQPGLFDDYIAISPSLWWDNEALVKAAPGMLPGTSGHRLWLSVANEQGMGVAPFAELLKAKAPAGLDWTYKPRPDETHATIYHGAALAAIRALFAAPGEGH